MSGRDESRQPLGNRGEAHERKSGCGCSFLPRCARSLLIAALDSRLHDELVSYVTERQVSAQAHWFQFSVMWDSSSAFGSFFMYIIRRLLMMRSTLPRAL